MQFEEFKQAYADVVQTSFGQGNFLPFWGNANAKIVSISQAPSISAVTQGKPFADKSGERLRKEWYTIDAETFYDQNNFYFTAVGRYYPGKGRAGDLKPSISFAEKWLPLELSYLQPKLYILIGRPATQFFFKKALFTDLIFHNQLLHNTPAIVLPHPSPRNIYWFNTHPQFEKKRLPQIRRMIHQVLK